MSGTTTFRPHRIRRGATLTLVFGAVLATGAATGSFGAAADGPGARTLRAGRAYSAGPAPHGAGDPGTDTAEIAWAIDEGKVSPREAARLVGDSGDRWSSYYTAGQYEGFQEELDGGYVGVGLWVHDTSDGRVAVSRVQSGSPARRAGVRAGDVLVAVDGAPVAGRPVTEVVSRLRGTGPVRPADPASTPAPAPGSTVRLGLRRAGHVWTVALHRALLTSRAVTVTHPAPGITSIAVNAFVRGVGTQVRDAMSAGGHRGGVLLDLRGNSGGLVTEATRVASVFLDGGLVATYDVHGTPHSVYARPGGSDTTTPLVVLTDGGTMSAAELLTGALQDRGRAVVVGARTFGKGSVQMPSTLPDGSAAELTVGHYRTPAGRTVDRRGIEPDLPLPAGTDPHGAVRAAETVLSGLGTRS